jgi:3-oxoacyl-[acyl-carrier-protein] synthase-3
VRQSVGDSGAVAEDIDYIVFSTTDSCLGLLGRDFAATVMNAVGLVRCIPVMMSFQQCCSSMSALRYGWDLFSGADVGNIVVVSLDFTPDDADRIRSFALFSDAVTSCLISRVSEGDLRLVSTAVNLDYSGLSGQDSFLSRQNAAQASLSSVFRDSGMLLEEVTKVFPTNLYQPLTLFNATIAGVQKDKLHFADTLRSCGHCGNGDWMMNLMDYQQTAGIRPGESYLAVASAPGFFACGLFLGR